MENKPFKLPKPEFEAEIYYLTAEEGGRWSAVFSGYRGQFYYDGKDWDAAQEFVDKDICLPGETVNVRMQTASPFFHMGKLYVGKTFEIREGAKTIGKGKITNVIRQEFVTWDFYTFWGRLPDDCKHYDKKSIEDFIAKLGYNLRRVGLIDKMTISEPRLGKDSTLTVECFFSHQNVTARDIYNAWQQSVTNENFLCKTESNGVRNKFVFKLFFVIWGATYLTGELTASANP